jgi:hypothetical protein
MLAGPSGDRKELRASTLLRERDGIHVRAEIVTWDVCVLGITVGGSSFVVCLAGDEYDDWLLRFDRGELDDELRRVSLWPPRRQLRGLPRSVRARQRQRSARVGVEHEYEVFRDGVAVDFRSLIPILLPGHVRADPFDLLATRFDWGVLTADGFEAEIATAPITIAAGFVGRTVDAAATGLNALRTITPAAFQLNGYSTHISVSWRPRRDDRLAKVWARIFGPVLMLLLDRPDSPGLIVRPRPGRLELCGDYCSGEQLGAAVAFATASTIALSTSSTKRMSQFAVTAQLQPSLQRYGWYVDRRAFGIDLYSGNGSGMLRRADGLISATDHAREMIQLVRNDLAAVSGDNDLDVLDRAMAGQVEFPLLENGLR